MKHTRLALATAGLVTCLQPAAANDWNTPQEPFALYGNTYYVGTHGLSAVLITSPQGHILIDGGSEKSAPQIVRNMRRLGFKVEDIRFILNSHAHFDHAGGIAELQRLSGAEVLVGSAAVPVLASGQADKGDPQYTDLQPMAPTARVRAVADGDVVKLGPLAVTMHATPGHTQGGASWTWNAVEGGRTAHMVYADSLNAIAAGPFRYRGHRAYPTARADLERSIATVAGLPCDVLVSAHPEGSDLWQRYARRAARGNAAFIDTTACRTYADKARARLAAQLAKETDQ
ncbi:subclass B3 metallo-beta-lactamase [Oxalobacteraceae sp. CFBP 13708]|nr:subclass B3 metallo-beta-lactamase [Oxalobacteraceae sp. CFBP 8761]MBD8722573.1 subclass B3 metallo-beta-lactamase [Oxalobacteraceae sp. CFBP 13708]